nr:uncharacterized protein LOC127310499 [Lolium perenne]
MSSGDDFDLSDSSSSDDSDLDELLQDDDLEATMLLLAVKDLEDRAKLLNRRRGSVFGRNHIQRNRLLGHEQLMEDYFAEVPTYPAHLFRRRYRMRRSLFVRIVKDCELHSNYFKQRRNAAGVMGFSAFQKISVAMRVIAYSIPADYTDEYLRIGEDTTTESVRRFARMIIKLYGPTYLRAPNEDDTKRLMEINEKRGWPGMLGSLDCMHWTWKNCPKAWHGQYCGKSKDATIVLEAVASQDLWIWHCFFGLPGTLNDINVLQRSPLFAKLANKEAPTCNYKVMNNEYTMGYYLADGIYPDWATFVKSVKDPQDRIEVEFAKAQEAARKDIERAFGVLQASVADAEAPFLGDIVAEAAIQIVCAAGDASQLFGTTVVDGDAPFVCAAILHTASKPLVASFVDADAAAFLGPGDIGGFLPFIPTPCSATNRSKDTGVGRGIREATYSSSG